MRCSNESHNNTAGQRLRTCSLRVALVGLAIIIVIFFLVVVFLFVLFLVGHLSQEDGRQLPSDQERLSRGILDVFCSYPMVRLVRLANTSRSLDTYISRPEQF